MQGKIQDFSSGIGWYLWLETNGLGHASKMF